MTAKVAFLEREPDAPIEVAPALPEAAVVPRRRSLASSSPSRTSARTRVPVRTRPAGEGWVALDEGPDEGSFVVAAPPPGLADGARVRIATP